MASVSLVTNSTAGSSSSDSTSLRTPTPQKRLDRKEAQDIFIPSEKYKSTDDFKSVEDGTWISVGTKDGVEVGYRNVEGYPLSAYQTKTTIPRSLQEVGTGFAYFDEGAKWTANCIKAEQFGFDCKDAKGSTQRYCYSIIKLPMMMGSRLLLTHTTQIWHADKKQIELQTRLASLQEAQDFLNQSLLKYPSRSFPGEHAKINRQLKDIDGLKAYTCMSKFNNHVRLTAKNKETEVQYCLACDPNVTGSSFGATLFGNKTALRDNVESIRKLNEEIGKNTFAPAREAMAKFCAPSNASISKELDSMARPVTPTNVQRNPNPIPPTSTASSATSTLAPEAPRSLSPSLAQRLSSNPASKKSLARSLSDTGISPRGGGSRRRSFDEGGEDGKIVRTPPSHHSAIPSRAKSPTSQTAQGGRRHPETPPPVLTLGAPSSSSSTSSSSSSFTDMGVKDGRGEAPAQTRFHVRKGGGKKQPSYRIRREESVAYTPVPTYLPFPQYNEFSSNFHHSYQQGQREDYPPQENHTDSRRARDGYSSDVAALYREQHKANKLQRKTHELLERTLQNRELGSQRSEDKNVKILKQQVKSLEKENLKNRDSIKKLRADARADKRNAALEKAKELRSKRRSALIKSAFLGGGAVATALTVPFVGQAVGVILGLAAFYFVCKGIYYHFQARKYDKIAANLLPLPDVIGSGNIDGMYLGGSHAASTRHLRLPSISVSQSLPLPGRVDTPQGRGDDEKYSLRQQCQHSERVLFRDERSLDLSSEVDSDEEYEMSPKRRTRTSNRNGKNREGNRRKENL